MIIENDTDTEGSCPKQKLYAKAADFLTANVERVKQLVDGVDHRRILVLQVLLPEALAFAVRREFQVRNRLIPLVFTHIYRLLLLRFLVIIFYHYRRYPTLWKQTVHSVHERRSRLLLIPVILFMEHTLLLGRWTQPKQPTWSSTAWAVSTFEPSPTRTEHRECSPFFVMGHLVIPCCGVPAGSGLSSFSQTTGLRLKKNTIYRTAWHRGRDTWSIPYNRIAIVAPHWKHNELELALTEPTCRLTTRWPCPVSASTVVFPFTARGLHSDEKII